MKKDDCLLLAVSCLRQVDSWLRERKQVKMRIELRQRRRMKEKKLTARETPVQLEAIFHLSLTLTELTSFFRCRWEMSGKRSLYLNSNLNPSPYLGLYPSLYVSPSSSSPELS